MTQWYCTNCKKHFEADATEPVCSFCKQSLGVWSEIIKVIKTCKLCDVLLDDSYRVRLDRKSPNGLDIRRREDRMVFKHLSQAHPVMIAKAAKALGFKVKRAKR